MRGTRNSWRDPRTGQFTLRAPNPFRDFWPASSNVNVRLHPTVRRALQTLAQREGTSVTHFVLTALEPLLRPLLPDPAQQLQDHAEGLRDRPHLPVSPHRLTRLADQVVTSIPSQHNPGDALAHTQRGQQQRRQFSGMLTDTKR
jgi:hypothetical protein